MATIPREEILRAFRKQERKQARAAKTKAKPRLPVACQERTIEIIAALVQLSQECGEDSWIGVSFNQHSRRLEKLLEVMDR